MGWYHTGPRIREADLDITALMGNYCENPLLVICEVEVGRSPPGPAPSHADLQKPWPQTAPVLLMPSTGSGAAAWLGSRFC